MKTYKLSYSKQISDLPGTFECLFTWQVWSINRYDLTKDSEMESLSWIIRGDPKYSHMYLSI